MFSYCQKLVALGLIFLSNLLPLASLNASEQILKYQVDISVLQNGDLLIDELITVQAEGQQIKRGIYRDFPTRYRDRTGHKFKVDLHVREVQRDGKAEPYKVVRHANGYRVYMGKEDHYLSSGQYTYKLSFKTSRQIGFFSNHDELYFNAIGHGWVFPIESVLIRLTLPNGVDRTSIKNLAFTGPQGALEKNYSIAAGPGGEIEFRTTQALNPFEGFTIVTTWPKGYVVEPTQLQRLLFLLRDNTATLVGLIGFLLTFGFYISAWLRVGQDPAKGTIIPLFKPAENLSPAAMRYIVKRALDKDAVAATVISIATKGYLLIKEPIKKRFILDKGKKIADRSDLSDDEWSFYGVLFAARRSIAVDNEDHEVFQSARTALKQSLVAQHAEKHFKLNLKQTFIGVGIVALTFFLMFFAVGFYLQDLFNISNVLIALLLIVMVFVFAELLEAPTHSGRKLMDQIEGFKMYLGTAERERLEMFHPPEDTPQIYEKYLAYAIALDVEHIWSERFAKILAAAAIAQSQSSISSWYRGTSNFSELGSSIGGSLGSAISSASTPPGSSSGSDGGGSSGGGGGGGGGGGW